MKYAINIETLEIIVFETEDFNKISKNYRTGDWREASEEEVNSYILDQEKKSKCKEIYALRDKKIIEDSIRYSEAQNAETAIDKLTSVEDIESHDITQYFN